MKFGYFSFFRLLTWVASACAVSSFACIVTAQTTHMYKWVDKDGVVHYSDKITNEAQNAEKHVLDNLGRPLKTIESASEYKENAEAAQAAAKPKTVNFEQKLQQDRDRALLQSYLSEKDFDIACERALSALQTQISAEKAVLVEQQARYSELTTRVAEGKIVPEGEIETLQQEMARNNATLRRYQLQREQIIQKYAKDKKRWRELKLAQQNQMTEDR